MPIKSDNKLKLGFIGAGTVGTALAVSLGTRGYVVASVASLHRTSAQRFADKVKGSRICQSNQEAADNADLVFITTPDDVIPVVASQLKWHPGQSVVHCSGADSTNILEPARRQGAQVGCIHPLQTFASIQQAIENLPGSTFALEAPKTLLLTLKTIVAALNGNPVVLKAEDKVAYHAAAVIASNYLVTLTKMATDLWQTFDVPPARSAGALMPLLQGTLNNIANVGIPNCLTGPIARGDIGTIRKHLDALEKLTPGLVSAYRELGLQTVPIALAKGKINEDRAVELKNILKVSN